MPITYQIDRDCGIVRAAARGDVSLEEERKCLESFLADPDHQPGFGILLDNRDRGLPASSEHVRGMAEAFERHKEAVGRARMAIVVNREVSLGLARMFALLTERVPIHTEAFSDINEAEAWLLGGGGGALPTRGEGGAREMMVSTDDGMRLFCRTLGEGGQTVIIPMATYHGDRFDSLADDFRVVLYDPRGRGRSDAVPLSKVSLENLLLDLDAIRRAVGAEETALIGWSSLGMELFVYALRQPGRVTKLVQLAPIPPRRDPYVDQLMRDRDERTDLEALHRLEQRRAAGEFSAAPAELCREVNSLIWPAMFADPSKMAAVPDVCFYPNEWPISLGPYLEVLLSSYGAYDWRPYLPSVEVPRLVVHGAQDNVPFGASREWVAGQKNARLLVVDEAGHWPHYEQPEEVLSAIAMFLAGGWPMGSQAVGLRAGRG
jgi:proline iminopeptidase